LLDLNNLWSKLMSQGNDITPEGEQSLIIFTKVRDWYNPERPVLTGLGFNDRVLNTTRTPATGYDYGYFYFRFQASQHP
jgi:hypothetical protein